MSSLIYLPFLASSGLGAAPSPPSAGFAGLTSFFFCSAISPSMGQRAVSQKTGDHDCTHFNTPLLTGV